MLLYPFLLEILGIQITGVGIPMVTALPTCASITSFDCDAAFVIRDSFLTDYPIPWYFGQGF